MTITETIEKETETKKKRQSSLDISWKLINVHNNSWNYKLRLLASWRCLLRNDFCLPPDVAKANNFSCTCEPSTNQWFDEFL